MTGVTAHPESTLLDRVLAVLAPGPQCADRLTRDVLGVARAPTAVAERLCVALLGADPRVVRLADGQWALQAAANGSPFLDDCAFAVVDVETTGMRAGLDDRIIEIAIVVVQGNRREMVFDSLVNPLRPIPRIVSGITGITEDMVRTAPTFADLADDVLTELSGRVFVAHNVRFDWPFVRAELRRARGVGLDGPRLCTVRLARRLVNPIESCSLDALTHHFGFENPARHRAGGDAIVTAQLLERLLPLARERGASTLRQLAALQVRRRKRPRRRQEAETPPPPAPPDTLFS